MSRLRALVSAVKPVFARARRLCGAVGRRRARAASTCGGGSAGRYLVELPECHWLGRLNRCCWTVTVGYLLPTKALLEVRTLCTQTNVGDNRR